MKFSDVASYLQKLEQTSSRNTMVEVLSELFEKTDVSLIDKVIYLLQGRVAPQYVALEFGMADKMMIRAIASAYDVEPEAVLKAYQKSGDLGKVSGEYAENMRRKIRSELSVTDVFETLKKVAETSGSGAVDVKIQLVSTLLSELDSVSACYVARIPVGKLRLGFSDMTVLDGLSWMLSKSKENRPLLEKVFNVHPDLGLLAKLTKEKGVESLTKVKPEVFTPILMARAERLSSGEEIIRKIGECAVESKYDGLRLQVHYKKGSKQTIKIYTRNLEDATAMFPDIVEAVTKQVKAQEIILEGEAIAYNLNTGEFLPFQETTQRRRKHEVDEKVKEIPLKLVCFELLFCEGKNFIAESYKKRREALENTIKAGEVLELSEMKIVDTPKDVELLFDDAVSRGLEGILAKKLDGSYQAGARGWNWIKFKRSYQASLDDTIDSVVMGYNLGQGKRTDFGIGAFLIGIYDKKSDKFQTIAKIGTGLSDVEWRELRKRCDKLKTKTKPALYQVSKMLEPDVWVEPSIVVEIRADEITRSPVHTAGRIMKPSKNGEGVQVDIPGYALRFPRLEKFRDDRKPEDATTLKEIEEMFENQSKHRTKSNE